MTPSPTLDTAASFDCWEFHNATSRKKCLGAKSIRFLLIGWQIDSSNCTPPRIYLYEAMFIVSVMLVFKSPIGSSSRKCGKLMQKGCFEVTMNLEGRGRRRPLSNNRSGRRGVRNWMQDSAGWSRKKKAYEEYKRSGYKPGWKGRSKDAQDNQQSLPYLKLQNFLCHQSGYCPQPKTKDISFLSQQKQVAVQAHTYPPPSFTKCLVCSRISIQFCISTLLNSHHDPMKQCYYQSCWEKGKVSLRETELQKWFA